MAFLNRRKRWIISLAALALGCLWTATVYAAEICPSCRLGGGGHCVACKTPHSYWFWKKWMRPHGRGQTGPFGGTDCSCPPQGPFFGYFPTCWHRFPEGWEHCPVEKWEDRHVVRGPGGYIGVPTDDRLRPEGIPGPNAPAGSIPVPPLPEEAPQAPMPRLPAPKDDNDAEAHTAQRQQGRFASLRRQRAEGDLSMTASIFAPAAEARAGEQVPLAAQASQPVKLPRVARQPLPQTAMARPPAEHKTRAATAAPTPAGAAQDAEPALRPQAVAAPAVDPQRSGTQAAAKPAAVPLLSRAPLQAEGPAAAQAEAPEKIEGVSSKPQPPTHRYVLPSRVPPANMTRRAPSVLTTSSGPLAGQGSLPQPAPLPRTGQRRELPSNPFRGNARPVTNIETGENPLR